VEGEQLGTVEDVVNFAYGRGLRARVAADRGSYDNAETLAREALGFAYKTDFPAVHAGGHRSLAHVLVLAGRSDEARRELDQALELLERYGYRSEAEKARSALEAARRASDASVADV
jgi:tetratricopeptide (TPR) repeat protein